MSPWEFEAIAAEARVGRVKPVYVLAGSDAHQKRTVLAAIRAGMAAGGSTVDETHLDGQASTPADVVVAAQTQGLLGRRLVVVDDAPWIAAPTKNGTEGANKPATEPPPDGGQRKKRRTTGATDALVRYLENPNPNSVVVLLSESPLDARLTTVRAAKTHGTVLTATCRGRERDLAEWCQRRAAEAHKVRLAPDAARLLCWRCPPDMGVLDQELAKLALAAAATGGDIMPDLVESVTPATREERVWSVLGAVAEGRPHQALASLRQVLERGENPLGVLALLTGQVRELAAARRAVHEGRSAAAYARERGIDPWRAERLLAQAARFRRATEFADALETLWGADTAVRTGWSEAAAAAQTAVALAAGRVRWAGPSVVLRRCLVASCCRSGGYASGAARTTSRTCGVPGATRSSSISSARPGDIGRRQKPSASRARAEAYRHAGIPASLLLPTGRPAEICP
jgi:DNA polymerase-3 subunit delta